MQGINNMKWVKILKANESLQEAVLFAERYDEAYNKMIEKQRERGSEYGTIGRNAISKEEEMLEEVDNILSEYSDDDEDVDAAYAKLPEDQKEHVMNIVLKALNN